MKASKEEKPTENGSQSGEEPAPLSERSQSLNEEPTSLPFPKVPETLEMDQTIRIFLNLVAELNGGKLSRAPARRTVQAHQKAQEAGRPGPLEAEGTGEAGRQAPGHHDPAGPD